MKKCVGASLLILFGQVFFSALFGGQPVAAVDNFTITNFEVEMEVGRDSEGRSTLRTIETITADFPETDENHGLERVMVKEYDGHPTNFKLVSVTDMAGNELPYHWNGDALRIGDEDEYVHGFTTYKIIYTQRDVTRYYEDTKKDELYWDVIGTEWRVPIEQATVWLTIAPELQDAIQTDLQCYIGESGSTDNCKADKTAKGVYRLSVEDVGQRHGVTLALGFQPETFMEYEPSFAERLLEIWIGSLVVTGILSFVIVLWLGIKAYRWRYREGEVGTVIPEYLPPKNASVAASAAVAPGHHATLAAQLIDLAVRHYIQIFETKPKRSFFQPAEYDIKVVKDISDLRAEEKEILSDMFGHEPFAGERMALKKLQNNTAAYTRFSDNSKKLTKLMRKQYGFDHIDEAKRRWFAKAAKIILIFSIVTLSPFLFIAWLVVFIISKTLWVLSDEGLVLQRYIKGLKLYIKVAEKDRIKMLQSPEGAEKIGASDPNDPAQLVKLYEKVLPYAVLFGQEKEWTKRIGDYYESAGSSPNWYSGNTAFNAAVFGSAMSNFSTAVSATSASSSSGGSSGGGSSGGGGGGGGGGGW